MEEILKYENRESLYKFLIDNFDLKKTEDEYYPDNFGNFYVVLVASEFSLRYSNDRSELSIEIASHFDNEKWYALSFIKDLIYNPESINSNNQKKDNVTRIEELNSFLRKDFNKISELFSKFNYPITKKKLDEGLRKQFYLRFPSARK